MTDDPRKRIAEAYQRALRSGVPDMEARRMALAEVDRPETSALNPVGLARSAFQGATFGFGDEAVAGWRGIAAMVPGGKSPAEAVAESLAQERTGLAAYREDNPIASTVAEIGGGVAGGVMAARGLAQAAPKVGAALAARSGGLKGLARLVGSGAAAGGLAAAGTAEGDVGDRLAAVPRGAAFGGAAAGIVGGGARLLRPVGRLAADVIPGARSGVVPGVASADDRAREMLVTALERDDSLDDVAGAATRRIRERAARAGAVPATIMDLGEEAYAPMVNTQGLGRAAAGIPGRARTTMTRELQERMAEQPERVRQAVTKGVGVSGDALEQADAIIAARSAKASPLYQQAYEAGREIVDPEINRLVDDPMFAQMYDRARSLIKTADDVDLPALYTELGEGGRRVNPVNIEALDRMKRMLDKTISSRGSSDAAADRDVARAVRSRLERVLERADEVVPEYGEARAAFAGESALLNALEAGKDATLKEDPRIIERMLSGQSPIDDYGRKITTDDQRDLFRLGALDKVRERIGKIRGETSDVARRLFGTAQERETFRALFPSPDDFSEFANRMRAEIMTSDTRNAVLSGSRTAPMAAEMADAGLDAAQDVMGVATNPVGGAIRAGMGAVGRRLRGQTEATMGSLAPRLTAGTQNRSDLLAVLDEIDDYISQRITSRTASSGATAGLSGIAGGAGARP